METYFVIYNDESDTTAESMSAEELTRRLNEDYYGKVVFIDKIKEKDINYWGENLAIIKGELIIPKATQKAVEWVVD